MGRCNSHSRLEAAVGFIGTKSGVVPSDVYAGSTNYAWVDGLNAFERALPT